jgi:phage-related protein
MASFPTLRTGAVAQYPADRTREFSTQVYRFLDGSEQRIAEYPAALRRWQIRLELLDEAELDTLQEFFLSEDGRAGSFSFTDPWDGSAHANCSFGGDVLALDFEGPMNGKTNLVVKEIR